MPIPIFIWVAVGAMAVFAAGVFWDEIKEWATQALGYILDAINKAIEVTSEAITYLVKQGTRVYKRIEVYVKNVINNAIRIEYRQEEISPYDIPEEIKNELDQKAKLKILQTKT